ncbi:MAG: sigma-70 family RNA polymerase sigma factor [Actinomycetales bacterium]|nr:sigma-70 family RNA polymerase sigma factor [Actinomycetales bacterium]
MTGARVGTGQPGGEPSDDVVVVLPDARPVGSRDAEFAAFMAAAQGELLHLAWLLVGDGHRAEELAQQALVRTYGAWPRARRDPAAYTRRVLVNLRTDGWRRGRREVLVAPDQVPEAGRRAALDGSSLDGAAAGLRPGRSATPDGGADPRVHDRDELVRVLAGLTSRQRRVVVLRYVVDLSEAEVAADLGISTGTVKSTASRALAQLRTALEPSADPESRRHR